MYRLSFLELLSIYFEMWYNERINTSAGEKKQLDCLQGKLFLFVYESVTNTEKPQVLRCVFMRS
jgi:hypothetical protein